MEQNETQDQINKKGFVKEFTDGIKKQMIEQARGEKKHHAWDPEVMRNWRSWGSWFSWGSPVGLGLFLISIGVFIVLLHVANLVGR